MAAKLLRDVELELQAITGMWGGILRNRPDPPRLQSGGGFAGTIWITNTLITAEGGLAILFCVLPHVDKWPLPLPSSPLGVLGVCAVWLFTFTPPIWLGFAGRASRAEREAAMSGMLLLPCLAASMLLAAQQANRILPWLVFTGMCIALLPASMRGPAVARQWLREKFGALAVALATGLTIFTQASPNFAAPVSPPQAGIVAAVAAIDRTIARRTITPGPPEGNRRRLPQSLPTAKQPAYAAVAFRSYRQAINADLSGLYVRRSRSGYHLYRLESGIPSPGGAMRPVTAIIVAKIHRQFASAVYPASPRQIRVESAKAAHKLKFFASDGSPLIWWTRAKSGRYLIFDGPGLDPHNGNRLRPATRRMVAKIVGQFAGRAAPAVYSPVAFRSYRQAIHADLSGLYAHRSEGVWNLYRLVRGGPHPGDGMFPVSGPLVAEIHRQFESSVYPVPPREIPVRSVRAARSLDFFAPDHSPLLWWARTPSGRYIIFNGPGLDPHNGVRLFPASPDRVAKILRQLTEETVYPAQ